MTTNGSISHPVLVIFFILGKSEASLTSNKTKPRILFLSSLLRLKPPVSALLDLFSLRLRGLPILLECDDKFGSETSPCGVVANGIFSLDVFLLEVIILFNLFVRFLGTSIGVKLEDVSVGCDSLFCISGALLWTLCKNLLLVVTVGVGKWDSSFCSLSLSSSSTSSSSISDIDNSVSVSEEFKSELPLYSVTIPPVETVLYDGRSVEAESFVEFCDSECELI